jgi:hypothetical protein
MGKGRFEDQDADPGRTKRSKFREYYDEDFRPEDDGDLQHREKKSSKRSHRPKTDREEFDPGFGDRKRNPLPGGDPGRKNRR